jgi:hypothetical protein
LKSIFDIHAPVLALSELTDSSSPSYLADDLAVVLDQVKDRLRVGLAEDMSTLHPYCPGLENRG